MLLVIKIGVTVLVILALAAVAEFVSSRLAGLLAGYPIGTAIVLYFYGLEQGVAFASASATYNLVGLTATLVFVCCYLGVLRRQPGCSPVLPSLAAFAGYLAAVLALGRFVFPQEVAVVVVISAILLASRYARDHQQGVPVVRVPYTLALVGARAVMAASLVVLITALAGGFGARWAGVLSAFPLALYPLLLMVHLQYGPQQAATLLRNFPTGLWSVLGYSLTVAYVYPISGLVVGTLYGFLVATACLTAFNLKSVYRLVTGGATVTS